MTHQRVFLVVLLLAGAALGQPGPPTSPVTAAGPRAGTPEPADFRAFVEAARASGMSEMAADRLLMVAGFLAKTDLIEPLRMEDGRYALSLSSAYSPKPGTDPAELRKIEAEMVARREMQIPKVRSWADLDGSGFVSEQEAAELEGLVELRLQAAFVAEQEKTRDGWKIADALHIPHADFERRWQKHEVLRERYGDEFGPRLDLDLHRPAGSAPPMTAAASPQAGATESADFRAFVETARAREMSDLAYLHLVPIAGALAKTTTFHTVKGEGGWYGVSSDSGFCPLPGADPEQVRKLRADIEAKRQVQLPRVKAWADQDGSGFVTSEEALHLRNLFELGLKVPFVAAQEKTRDPGKIAAALRMPPPDFLQVWQEYRALQGRYGDEFGPRLELESLQPGR